MGRERRDEDKLADAVLAGPLKQPPRTLEINVIATFAVAIIDDIGAMDNRIQRWRERFIIDLAREVKSINPGRCNGAQTLMAQWITDQCSHRRAVLGQHFAERRAEETVRARYRDGSACETHRQRLSAAFFATRRALAIRVKVRPLAGRYFQLDPSPT